MKIISTVITTGVVDKFYNDLTNYVQIIFLNHLVPNKLVIYPDCVYKRLPFHRLQEE